MSNQGLFTTFDQPNYEFGVVDIVDVEVSGDEEVTTYILTFES